MEFRLKDHKKSIKIFVAILAIIFVIVALLQISLVRNPELIAQLRAVVQKYGIVGGFFTAAIGSLWFIPFPYELIIAPLLKFSKIPILAILIVALGATAADIFNFYSGRKVGEKYLRKKVDKRVVDKVEDFFEKYGILAFVVLAFISPVTSYDLAVFVIGGFSKMNYEKFIPLTFICRAFHFTLVYFIADVIIKIAGVSSYLILG